MIEQSKVVLFVPQDRHDILVEAIGTEEPPGRARGLGRGVDFNFGSSNSFREVNRIREMEEIVVVKMRQVREKWI